MATTSRKRSGQAKTERKPRRKLTLNKDTVKDLAPGLRSRQDPRGGVRVDDIGVHAAKRWP
jgi:hypothetical protein